tara:strand:+ start:882 stop:1118 length:237 start_codon:yes stop_codon:yes gene_type:complete
MQDQSEVLTVDSQPIKPRQDLVDKYVRELKDREKGIKLTPSKVGGINVVDAEGNFVGTFTGNRRERRAFKKRNKGRYQ